MTKIVGKITVPVAGTPIQLSVQTLILQALNPAGTPAAKAFTKVQAILLQALFTNTGKIYIGNAGLVKATYVGVGYTLIVPSATAIPSFGMALNTGAAGVDLAEVYLDADNSGEGVSVTLQVS